MIIAFGGNALSMDKGQRYTFRKDERITGKKRIDTLFARGHSFLAYPFKVVFYEYAATHPHPVAVLVTIPKKRLKRATARNRMKRLFREAYRLNRHRFASEAMPAEQRMDVAFIYLKEELTSYDVIEKSVCKALRLLSEKIKKG